MPNEIGVATPTTTEAAPRTHCDCGWVLHQRIDRLLCDRCEASYPLDATIEPKEIALLPSPEHQPVVPTRPKTKADPVMEGYRLELLRVLGDEDQPLDTKNLHLIIELATAARQILLIRSPVPRRSRGCFAGPFQNSSSWAAAIPDPMDVSDDYPGEPLQTVTFSSANPINNIDRETFGAKILREIVAIVPELARSAREDPAQTVRAIAAAREIGLLDLAAALEKKLLPQALSNAEAPAPAGGQP